MSEPKHLNDNELRQRLERCNHAMAKDLLLKNLAGGVLPKPLIALLDSFLANPSTETAFRLVRYDPKFIAFFDLARKGGVTEGLSPNAGASREPLKPDYGLRLVEEGVSSGIDIFFHDFQLFSLTVLRPWEYSTTNNHPYKGKVFAVSFDFNQAVLDKIIEKAAPEVARSIRAELESNPSSARTFDLPSPISFGVRARLGKLQSVEKEQFVPLVIHEII